MSSLELTRCGRVRNDCPETTMAPRWDWRYQVMLEADGTLTVGTQILGLDS